LIAVVGVAVYLAPLVARAQVRGVYPVGMNATNSGGTPEPGLTYSNLFVFFSRDEKKDAEGNVVATGRNSILMDLNTFLWVTNKEIGFLGGAIFSASATLPVANNSLTSDIHGSISGGGGFADSFYQPAILGWRKKRADFRVIYGFLAPTGRFDATADDNVGSGYWTSVISSGQTIYLDASKRTNLSAFQMYEFHGTQEGTDIDPGQTLNLDYSLTRTFPLQKSLRLQIGFAGYGQWQTSDKTGPGISEEVGTAHYKVNGLGFAANAIVPDRKASVGIKYFREVDCKSTFQGYTLQISGSIKF
jgi:hypothetical protein